MNSPDPDRPAIKDLDATDELPMLDAAEIGRLAIADDSLASTDTWHASTFQVGERERIAALEEELQEREAILHSLRGDLAVTTSDRYRLETDLESILGNLGALEARLREIEGHNASLEERIRQMEAEALTLRAQLTVSTETQAALTAERDALSTALNQHEAASTQQIAALDQERVQLRAWAKTGNDELKVARAGLAQLTTENAAQRTKLEEYLQAKDSLESASRGSAQRQQQLERELEIANARIARYLEALQSSEARQRYVEDFAAATEAERIGTEQLQAELARDLAASRATTLQLSTDLAGQQAQVGRLEQLVAERGDVTASLQADLRRQTEAALQAGRELQAALAQSDALRIELKQRESEVAASAQAALQLREEMAVAARSASAQQSAELLLIGERDALLRQVATLDAARTQVSARVLQLEAEAGEAQHRQTELQQAYEAQTEELDGWREVATRLGNSGEELRARDERIRDLEQQLGFVHDEQAEGAAELEALRIEHERLRTERDERATRVGALEDELSARADVLDAIRRDIGRIGEAPTPAANETLVRTLAAMDSDSDVVHVLSRKVLSIGRTPENDIAVDSKHVSRRHARLLVGPTAVIFEDLGSTNGCFVNGRRIRKQVLHDGDLVIVGKTRFRFASHLATA